MMSLPVNDPVSLTFPYKNPSNNLSLCHCQAKPEFFSDERKTFQSLDFNGPFGKSFLK